MNYVALTSLCSTWWLHTKPRSDQAKKLIDMGLQPHIYFDLSIFWPAYWWAIFYAFVGVQK